MDALVAASLARADKLEDKLAVAQSQQLTFLQTLLTQSQQAKPAPESPAAKRAAAEGSPATPLEMLRELVKLKDGLAGLTDTGASDSTPASRTNPGNQPWWAALLQHLPQIMQAGATIASMAAVASYNSAIAKTGTGTPTPVAMPAIAPPSAEPELEPGDESPQPPAADESDNQPLSGDAAMNAYHMFLSQLRKPLLLALENNEPGDQFAEKLVGWQGQVAYDLLHGLGRDQLIQILSTYKPIWEVVSTIPVKFSQFLDEFMSYGDSESASDLPPVPPQPASPGAKIHNPRAGKKNPPNPAGPTAQ
jgi:hypothetical protein